MSAPEQDYDQGSATWTGGDHDAGAATDATAAAATGARAESTGATGRSGPQVAQQNMHYIEETGRWTYTDAEGISFEYDENLKAWFPMVSALLLPSCLITRSEKLLSDRRKKKQAMRYGGK